MGKAGRILVVDDEFEIAQTVSAILEDEGFEVATAYSGTGALESLRGHAFDVVVMDIMMPYMDGITALRTIKADSAYDALPVVMMSAVEPRGGNVRELASAFLRKPFTLDELLDVVRGLLALAAGRSTPGGRAAKKKSRPRGKASPRGRKPARLR